MKRVWTHMRRDDVERIIAAVVAVGFIATTANNTTSTPPHP